MGGVRALNALGVSPGVYSMNEGHAAFLGLELLEEELRETSFEDALERTRSRVVYTNHTVVPAGNDVFSRDMANHYLSGLSTESGVSLDDFDGLASHGGQDGFSMADLAFHLSGRANAVSELHARVIPREWPGYSVEAVTNGVHVPTWVGPDIAALFDRYVPDWRGDAPRWEAIRSIPDKELLAAHEAQRAVLADFANHRQDRARLDPNALTIAWARRFAEYKRAWLIASDLPRLARLLGSTERPVQLIIAGKAHPRDEGGKRILQDLLRLLESQPETAARVAFIEDYDERVARYITMGADVWLNTPRKPLEASGTSGMKASDNGCLQLTVTDGWAAEVDWWGVGWGIDGTDDASDSRQLYSYLEDGVVPTFYRMDENGIASDWAAMMKNSMIVTLTRYSTRRMVLDYVNKLYLPLLGEQRATASA